MVRCQAAVVVTGDDEQVIATQAKRLADAYWGARDEFKFVAPTGTLEECLERAVASTARPDGSGEVSLTNRRLGTARAGFQANDEKLAK